MSDSNEQIAHQAIEKALAMLRAVQVLEGTDKDDVDRLLELAEERLKPR